MPKYLTAIWVWIALLGSLLGAVLIGGGGKASSKAMSSALSATMTPRTSPIAVPIFSDRKVDGYVITQVRYLPDSALSDPTTSPMEAVMRNALHIMVYRDESFDRSNYPSKPLEELEKELLKEVNLLFDYEAVKSLSLEYAYFAPFGSPEMSNPAGQKKK